MPTDFEARLQRINDKQVTRMPEPQVDTLQQSDELKNTFRKVEASGTPLAMIIGGALMILVIPGLFAFGGLTSAAENGQDTEAASYLEASN